MAAAAVSVTLVSLVGIAAITNLLPSSHGSSADTASPISLAAPVAAPLAEATIRNNHETLRNKPVAHQNAPTPSHPPAAPVAQISPVGIGVGAVIGGLLGNQVGGGNGKTLATIAGAVGGGYLGNEVAKKNQ